MEKQTGEQGSPHTSAEQVRNSTKKTQRKKNNEESRGHGSHGNGKATFPALLGKYRLELVFYQREATLTNVSEPSRQKRNDFQMTRKQSTHIFASIY